MKISQVLAVVGFALFAGLVSAEETKPEVAVTELPTNEKAFVEVVGKLNKAKIVELLGEPSKAEDVKLKDSGRVVASIWHYHNINTDEEGAYYQTTELDFIDDKVNVVVFLNNDGSDVEAGKKHQVPDVQPEM